MHQATADRHLVQREHQREGSVDLSTSPRKKSLSCYDMNGGSCTVEAHEPCTAAMICVSFAQRVAWT